MNTNELFDNYNHLWLLTEEASKICIGNYLETDEAIEIGLTNFKVEDFSLIKHKQSLIFNSAGINTFVVRTTYLLETKNNQSIVVSGEYSLDVNKQNEVIDDWLILR